MCERLRASSPKRDQIEVEKRPWSDEQPVETLVHLVESGLITNESKVIDVGCGIGRNSNYLAAQGCEVHAINIDHNELAVARTHAEENGVAVDYTLADARELPYPDESMDWAIDYGCSHVFSDLGNQNRVRDEILRVLKPSGYLLFFGFNEEHPARQTDIENIGSYRSLADLERQYGDDFDFHGFRDSE